MERNKSEPNGRPVRTIGETNAKGVKTMKKEWNYENCAVIQLEVGERAIFGGNGNHGEVLVTTDVVEAITITESGVTFKTKNRDTYNLKTNPITAMEVTLEKPIDTMTIDFAGMKYTGLWHQRRFSGKFPSDITEPKTYKPWVWFTTKLNAYDIKIKNWIE